VSESASVATDRYQRAIDFLYGRLNFERTPDAAASLQDFKLARMEELLNHLGNPQRQVPTVHIAGSKGKGSTATMIARIAESAGYRVGLFTSPHVDQLEERFTINSETATRDQVIEMVDVLIPIVERMNERYAGQSVTFFELVTALGWLHFLRSEVDLAVIEVGLGGRLDSTNVCNPLVTVITSISRDHTRLLGDTLREIASEKAGIIKPNVPVISGVILEEPAQAIAEIAGRRAAPLYRLGQEFQCHPHHLDSEHPDLPTCYQVDVKSEFGTLENLQLSMPGEHQTRNATLAVVASQLLVQHGFEIGEQQIRDGLQSANCPLRIEIMDRSPLVIIDAAHNAASIAALCDTLKSVSVTRRHVIFATSRDKEVDSLLSILNEYFDQFWLTRYSNNPRTVTLEELEEIASKVLTKPWSLVSDPRSALRLIAETAQPDELVCVTGSFFLAAEAKHLLENGLKAVLECKD